MVYVYGAAAGFVLAPLGWIVVVYAPWRWPWERDA